MRQIKFPEILDFESLPMPREYRNALARPNGAVETDDIIFSLQAIEKKIGVDNSIDKFSFDYRINELEDFRDEIVFTDLGDVPSSYSGYGGYVVKVKTDESGLEFSVGGGSVVSFTDLDDVPASYSGCGGYFVKVNSGATALEFVASSVGAHQLDSATYHTVSGLTDGHFLKATGANSFGFEAHGLTYSDVGAAASSHSHPSSEITDWGTYVNQAVLTSSSPTFVNLTITSFASNWTNAGRTVADLGIITTCDINGGSIDGTAIGANSASTAIFTTAEATTNLGLGNSQIWGTSANKVFCIGIGTAPASSPVNAVQIYGANYGVDTTGCVHFRDEEGNVQRFYLNSATADLGTVLSNCGLRTAGTAYPITTSGTVQFTGSVTATGGLSLSSNNLTMTGVNISCPGGTGVSIGTLTTQLVSFHGVIPCDQAGATEDLGTVLSDKGLRASGTAYPITTSGAVNLSGSLTIECAYSNGGTYVDSVDTITNGVAVIAKNVYIYTTSGTGYLRKMIGADSSNYIYIGQTGTSLVPGIILQAGNAGYISFVPGTGEALRLASDKTATFYGNAVFSSYISSNLLPSSADGYDLGSSTYYWNDTYTHYLRFYSSSGAGGYMYTSASGNLIIMGGATSSGGFQFFGGTGSSTGAALTITANAHSSMAGDVHLHAGAGSGSDYGRLRLAVYGGGAEATYDVIECTWNGTERTLGFFNVTPVVRQSHLADPAATTAALASWAANINLYLERYGLMKTS